MLPPRVTRWFTAASCIFLFPALALAQAATSATGSPVSPEEIRQLRPVVVPDLDRLLKRVLSEGHLSDAYLDREFAKCRFTRIDLGPLGAGVLVDEPDLAGMANEVMLNIYVPAGKTWRLVASGGGFGPKVIASQTAVPDLVYGWANGVCQATYNRLTWHKDRYVPDACDQEVPGTNGTGCGVRRCTDAARLPTFPNPWSSAGATAAPAQ